MSCKIGMTTNLQQREAYWRRQYPNLWDWKVLEGPFYTRELAQERETKLAQRYGCESHYGNDEPDTPDSIWHVYYFSY